MKDLDNISNVYFLGIGGIGMSALARYFISVGKQVRGYDKTPTVLTRKLEDEGIAIHFEDDVTLLDKNAELIIYTPALPSGHSEYNYYKENNYSILKRSDVLGLITKSSYNICVAGTHGKTTTSAMIGHIFRHSGLGCTAFLGGIATNYNTNFWSSQNENNRKKICVVEADEYDRSFLKLFPDVAVITAMDADHLDIYGTAEKLEEAFIEFGGQVKTGGLLILKHGLLRSSKFSSANKMTYSMNNNAAGAFAENIRLQSGSYVFDAVINQDCIKDVELNMGGMHNIENVMSAIAVSKFVGITGEKIKAAVTAFRGVKRRFEYIIKRENVVMIDDYAHHPEELRALITGAKELFPEMQCTVIFQPHLFSRTKDFADGFAEVLSLSDNIILLPIYPAREKPMEGVNSELIMGKMKNRNVQVLDKVNLLNEIKTHKRGLLITAGAGDIDMLVEPLSQILNGTQI
ncbi:MAG: UDP-N-acetylmuramate--L-alanine ligase [Ferruginibacter sp.]